MKTIKNVFFITASFVLAQGGYSQGFSNLNFESANLSGYPPGSGNVPTTAALPDWTAYYLSSHYGTNVAGQVGYDSVSLGSAFISITDTNNNEGLVPLQGKYSALLACSTSGEPTGAAIGQTGQIPINALSLTFFLSLDSNIQVSFDGQIIPLIQTGSTPNYDIMGGDISAFSGQAGQLLFTALPNLGYGLIDNIEFSSSPVPEPGVLGLSALGGLCFAWRRWRKSSR